MDVSVVLPCLNEEEGVGICLNKIQEVFRNEGLDGEVIIVDNGCTDDTVKVVKELGFSNVRVVYEFNRGYGNAYRAGFREAKGDIVIMGDADNTYDFYDIPRFLDKVAEYDFVMGSRFLGKMEKGAMPFLHRYIGNPAIRLSFKVFYGLNFSEPSTGFVAIRKEALEKLPLKESGMEFSSEMLIKAKRNNLSMTEIPIDYHVRKGKPKLRTFRDGARHLNLITRELLH
jgi:glycosyltransferase involved in cell wall biosynthesis